MEFLEERVSEIEKILKEAIELNLENQKGIASLYRYVDIISEKVDRISDRVDKLSVEVTSLSAEVTRLSNEVTRISKEVEKNSKEMEKNNKETNKKWAQTMQKMGTLTEDLIYPAFKPTVESHFNCNIDIALLRYEVKLGDINDEFDVIGVSESCKKVFLVEVKSSPKINYIQEFMNDKLPRFKEFFMQTLPMFIPYKDYEVVPIVATVLFPDNIINFLTKNNIYAMAYKEWEYMDILNFEDINNRKK